MSSSYLDPQKFNLILHPLSQGSAPAWSLEHYQKLMELLSPEDVHILITGTAAEAVKMSSFLGFAEDWGAVNCAGETSLDELMTLTHYVDGLIAASTGPLHIAAAMGTRALGLFTQLRPMHAGRWMPLGANAETMMSKRECSKCTGGNTCACMNELAPERVASTVAAWVHDKRSLSNHQSSKSHLQTTAL
jgi:heptosyltransferase III